LSPVQAGPHLLMALDSEQAGEARVWVGQA
jgi:hypothetical protein